MRHLLDRHGYSFQLAVEKRIRDLSDKPSSSWEVHTAEFPVEGEGWNTRIDLVLKASRNLMVVECKRVDPALAWFFARGSQSLRARVEIDQFVGKKEECRVGGTTLDLSAGKPFHIGLVGRSGDKGDGSGAGRDQLETACTQVIRGASGLINFLADNFDPTRGGLTRRVIPAIVTTSELLATEADLASASLEDGLLPRDVEVEEKDWLWYQYQRSPNLEHNVSTARQDQNPKQANWSRFPRTIAVVNAQHLGRFLKDSADWL